MGPTCLDLPLFAEDDPHVEILWGSPLGLAIGTGGSGKAGAGVAFLLLGSTLSSDRCVMCCGLWGLLLPHPAFYMIKHC